MRFAAPPISVALLVLASCATGPNLQGTNPTMENIQAAIRNDDTSVDTLYQLVGYLDSHDIGVRMAAIDALARLTGETHGYMYDGSKHDRRQAIDRWLNALETAHG